MSTNIDGIKPPAKTALEDWSNWLNSMETQLRTAPWYSARKVIDVQFEDDSAVVEFEESDDHICDDLEPMERCQDCIEDYYDGQIQMAEDRFRYDHED